MPRSATAGEDAAGTQSHRNDPQAGVSLALQFGDRRRQCRCMVISIGTDRRSERPPLPRSPVGCRAVGVAQLHIPSPGRRQGLPGVFGLCGAGLIAPCRIVGDAVGRVRHHQVRGKAVQQVRHVIGAGGVAAEQAVLAQAPEITGRKTGTESRLLALGERSEQARGGNVWLKNLKRSLREFLTYPSRTRAIWATAAGIGSPTGKGKHPTNSRATQANGLSPLMTTRA